MGRDVGSDEGREQAEWRDLVARLELQAPIDPADAPWPDRENLRTKTQPGAVGSAAASGLSTPAVDGTRRRLGDDMQRESGPSESGPDDSGPEDSEPRDGRPGGAGTAGAVGSDKAAGDSDDGDASNSGRRSADRGRVIRPAGFAQFPGPDEPATRDLDASQSQGSDSDEQSAAGVAGAAAIGEPALGGPRDYELDQPSDNDLDDEYDDRYIPPPLPPQPSLDPVAKGAWLALFGGPGYLLIATLLGWQIAGWAALTAVISFVAGFVVLVFRLGDGPSKRDGPDQGAVV